MPSPPSRRLVPRARLSPRPGTRTRLAPPSVQQPTVERTRVADGQEHEDRAHLNAPANREFGSGNTKDASLREGQRHRQPERECVDPFVGWLLNLPSDWPQERMHAVPVTQERESGQIRRLQPADLRSSVVGICQLERQPKRGGQGRCLRDAVEYSETRLRVAGAPPSMVMRFLRPRSSQTWLAVRGLRRAAGRAPTPDRQGL